jgi:hypothetical protein
VGDGESSEDVDAGREKLVGIPATEVCDGEFSESISTYCTGEQGNTFYMYAMGWESSNVRASCGLGSDWKTPLLTITKAIEIRELGTYRSFF